MGAEGEGRRGFGAHRPALWTEWEGAGMGKNTGIWQVRGFSSKPVPTAAGGAQPGPAGAWGAAGAGRGRGRRWGQN